MVAESGQQLASWPEPTRSRTDPERQLSVTLARWRGLESETASDELAVEEPLDIRAITRLPDDTETSETLAVILRTPGSDDELACGFLYSEGLVQAPGEIAHLRPGLDEDGLPSPNILDVVPAPGVDLAQRAHDEGYSRKFAVNSSCGICGKNTVAAACAVFPRMLADDFSVSPDVLYALPERLRAEQQVFSSTGGLHAAGLFTPQGELLALREDVGRHNAVDKLIGRALLNGELPLRERILVVSGRLSFEIVLKAQAARISVIAAVSAPSSLAVDLARSGGITLAGFLRGTGVNVYTWPERVRA